MDSVKSTKNTNKTNVLPDFFEEKVECTKHKSRAALSICKTCKVFSCDIPNCGSEHLYHDLNNIQSWLRVEIRPFFEKANILEAANTENQLVKSLKSYKRNVDRFIKEMKIKCDVSYRASIDLVESIYYTALDEINSFGEETNSKFEVFQTKVEILDKSETSFLSKVIAEANSRERSQRLSFFLQEVIKNPGLLKIPENSNHNQAQNKTKSYEEQLEKIKVDSALNYEKIKGLSLLNSIEKYLGEEKNRYIAYTETKVKKPNFEDEVNESKHYSKIKNSMIKSNEVKIDLDIFVRELAEKLNEIRQNPLLLNEIIEDFQESDKIARLSLDMSNSNTSNDIILSNLKKNLSCLKRQCLWNLDWDNDLSCSAEEFYKLFDVNYKANIDKMKDVIYSNFDGYSFTHTIFFAGSPIINLTILKLLIEQGEILLGNKVNHIGIFATPIKRNSVLIIINLSKFE